MSDRVECGSHKADPAGARLWALAFAVLVAALTFIAFLPSLSNRFVNWDDPSLIVANEHIRSFTPANLRWMFTSFHMGPYEPIPFMTLAVDYALWGLEPRGFHLSSLLWHTANALLFYLIVRRLLLVWRNDSQGYGLRLGVCSAFAALVFAVHPLRVEPVAWAAGRLDVVAGFFGLACIWSYLRAVAVATPVRRAWLVGSQVLFALSLLCKASTLMLPAVLSVLDFVPLGRLHSARWRPGDAAARSVWLEKLPYWLLATVAAFVTIYGRQSAGALAPLSAYGPLDRLLLAGYSFAFHLFKTVVPWRLSPLYEMPDEIQWEPRFLAGVVVTAGITALLLVFRNRLTGVCAAWLAYLILLLPASGLAQTGAQLAADRYTYLPGLGFAVVAGGLALHWTRAQSVGRWVLGLIALGSLVMLSVLTWRQAERWHDSHTLWDHALSIDSGSSKALTNLGCAVAEDGDYVQARSLLQRAVAARPRSHAAHSNLGLVLRLLGDSDAALGHLAESVQWGPVTYEIAQSLGSLYQERGEWSRAAGWYERALGQRPDSPVTLAGLGTVRIALNDLDRAVPLLERAVQTQPDNAAAHNSLGIAMRRLKRKELAEQHLLQACRLQPNSADFCYNLGHFYLSEQQWQPAIEWYQRAVVIDPQLEKALNDLGIAHKKMGHPDAAIEWYQRAIEAKPDGTESRFNLALALVEKGDVNGGMARYREVLELNDSHVPAAYRLAELHSAVGDDAAAAGVLDKAAQATGHPALVERLVWLLAASTDSQVRDGMRAIELAEQLAVKLPLSAAILDAMAAAYAEIGDFERAVSLATRAIELARDQPDQPLARQMADRLARYRSGMPYRFTRE